MLLASEPGRSAGTPGRRCTRSSSTRRPPRSLGYERAGDYAATVTSEVDWLVRAADGRGGQRVIGDLDDEFFGPMLDYAAEDRY